MRSPCRANSPGAGFGGGAGSAIRVSRRSRSCRATSSTTGWRLAEPPPTDGMGGPAGDLLARSRAQRSDVPAESSQGGESGARARRDGPGRSAGARSDHVRFVRGVAADDHAPVAAPPRAASGRAMVLFPRRCARDEQGRAERDGRAATAAPHRASSFAVRSSASGSR